MKTKHEVIVFATVVVRLAALSVVDSGLFTTGLALATVRPGFSGQVRSAMILPLAYTIVFGAALWFGARMIGAVVSSDIFRLRSAVVALMQSSPLKKRKNSKRRAAHVGQT